MKTVQLESPAGHDALEALRVIHRPGALDREPFPISCNTEHAIHLCGPVASALTFFPRAFVHTKDWYRADYSICFQRPGYDERSPGMPLYHAIQRDGVTLTPILAAKSRLPR